MTKLLLMGALALSSAPAWASPAAAQTPATPDRVDLSSWQTGIRNQQDRNTCSGFAMVAAIEARYRRQWGTSLDLSEQYYWHVYKSTGVEQPAPFRYENQSSFWGGGGAWGLEAARTYAIPLESAVPYLTQSQMNTLRDSIPGAGQLAWNPDPTRNTVTQAQVDAFEYSERYIPPSARQNARYGVTRFTNYPSYVSRDTAAVERLIASNREVIVGLNLNWRWNANRTVRVYDSTVNEGQHVFLIVGYDRPAKQFIVKNSWGEAGPIRVSYDVIANSSFEAATVDDVPSPNTISSTKGRFLGTWNVDFDGHRGRAVIRRATPQNVATTRLGHFRFDGESLDRAINGGAINGGRGIEFSIEGSTNAPLGQMTGTIHRVDHGTSGQLYASGENLWNNIPFGTLMSRSSITGVPGTFSGGTWVGNWRVTDDGVALGTLRVSGAPVVNGVHRLNATFFDGLGVASSVTATTRPNQPHVLDLAINLPYGTKRYVLMAHGRETNLASGMTWPTGTLPPVVVHGSDQRGSFEAHLQRL